MPGLSFPFLEGVVALFACLFHQVFVIGFVRISLLYFRVKIFVPLVAAGFRSWTWMWRCHFPLASRRSTITGEMILRTSSGPKCFGASFALYALYFLQWVEALPLFLLWLVSMTDALSYNTSPADRKLRRGWCARSQKLLREHVGSRWVLCWKFAAIDPRRGGCRVRVRDLDTLMCVCIRLPRVGRCCTRTVARWDDGPTTGGFGPSTRRSSSWSSCLCVPRSCNAGAVHCCISNDCKSCCVCRAINCFPLSKISTREHPWR